MSDGASVSAPVAALVERLRSMIRERELQPGEKLGAERELARQLGVSRAELRAALAVLEASHDIIRRIGRAGGVVVSDGRLERNINTVESLPVIARRQGMRVSSRVLRAAIAPASAADRRMLRLSDSQATVFDITRLRFIDDAPLSLERTHLPTHLFPGFVTQDLTEPFYALFERCYGIQPVGVDETLEATAATAEESRLLEVPEGTTLMTIHRVSVDADGVPCERAVDAYVANRMRFTMHHSGYVRLSATAKPAS